MTIDSSALVAIVFKEPGSSTWSTPCSRPTHVRIGAPTLVEAGMVAAGRKGTSAERELDISVVPFGEPEWRAARLGYERFARGRHKAALNFGDCLAYASAAVAGDTLLFVGNDFRRTDTPSAL